MRRVTPLLLVACLASGAAGFLVSNARSGSRFIYERLPEGRVASVLVDTESVPGVSDPVGITQTLMNQWNAVEGATSPFGTATAGGPYNGDTVAETFGVFTNSIHEVAFDDTGDIFRHFGVSASVLGITLKTVDAGSGHLLDFLVVINTAPAALSAPGTGATSEELFRGTLLHELGHATGLGHTPVGMVNPNSFGLESVSPTRIPSMYPFRLPIQPQAGVDLERDDEAALVFSYPEDTSGFGSISGRVRSASGAPVNELAVRAVGPQGNGVGHIGILTNGDGSGQGRFTIPNLEPGRYRVLVESVNGRSGVDSEVLAGGPTDLGAAAFLYAQDEYYQPTDSYDPATDSPGDFAEVVVREGRDSGSIDVVLNARPILEDQEVSGSLGTGDAQFPGASGGFRFVDYYLFRGTAGQEVTLTASSGSFTPQLILLNPSSLQPEAEELPAFGRTTELNHTLAQSGIYTLALSTRMTTGNTGGTGSYSLLIEGAGAAFPAIPAPTPARVQLGSASPGNQEYASPVCQIALLQIEVEAPSNEQLWVDRIDVSLSGSADDARDVTELRLVRDLDGNGEFDPGEPVVGVADPASNDATVAFEDLGMRLAAGEIRDLLVVLDAQVVSVATTSVAGFWLAPLLLPLLLLRRFRARGAVIVLALALLVVPTGCGGGGGEGCNGPFDPAGAVVTFGAGVEPGGVVAFTPTSDPAAPLPLPASTLDSGTLSVSN